MKTQTILKNLTLEQADAWNETSEKYLFIDYEIVSQYGISLNSLPNNNLLEAIEEKFEKLLNNRAIPLCYEDWESLARAMQWPEDLTQWDKDHDRTPTPVAWLTI
jgi:hypothetical protein